MSKLLNDIKLSFGNAKALYRLMLINVLVFLTVQIIRLAFFFTGNDASEASQLIAHYFGLYASVDLFITKPWTFITYMFLHIEFFHIFFNLLIFYWTGRLFTEYLGNDKLWAIYILGALTGAFLYVVAYNVLPVFNQSVNAANLMGASAGVIAVMVAIATLLPDYTVMLLIFGQVKLKYIALFSVLLYAISIPDGNAGGNIAHLGGALFGFMMIRQLRSGNDLTAWLINLAQRFSKPKIRVVHSKKNKATDEEYLERQKAKQETIDQILDKISQSGYGSLTAEEKEILFKASKNMKE